MTWRREDFRPEARPTSVLTPVKRDRWVISKFAARLCIAMTFLAGLSVGAAVMALLIVEACK